MSKNRSHKVRRSGVYVVKGAESGSSRVHSKNSGTRQQPSTDDRKVVDALIRNKRG